MNGNVPAAKYSSCAVNKRQRRTIKPAAIRRTTCQSSSKIEGECLSPSSQAPSDQAAPSCDATQTADPTNPVVEMDVNEPIPVGTDSYDEFNVVRPERKRKWRPPKECKFLQNSTLLSVCLLISFLETEDWTFSLVIPLMLLAVNFFTGGLSIKIGEDYTLLPTESKAKCVQCDFTTKKPDHMENHINDVHKETTPYMCTQCGDRFSGKQQLDRHIKCQHKTRSAEEIRKQKERDREKRLCNCCGKLLQKSVVLKHERRAASFDPFEFD